MTTNHPAPSDLTAAHWHRSTYSGGQGDCVEVSDNVPHVVPVRDSKHPAGPTLTFSTHAWNTFLTQLR